MKNLKVKVLKKYLDRYAGVYRNPGDVLEVSEKRYREIKLSGNYVEVIKAEKVTKAEKTEPATPEIKK